MNKFELDLNFGFKKEDDCECHINKYFKTKVIKTIKGHLFDYFDDNGYYELKSRRNTHNKYPTTIIGLNKIKYVENNPNNTYHFLFWFSDGLYYIEYNKEQFSKYEITLGGRNDRGKVEIKDYLYIPITDLKKII